MGFEEALQSIDSADLTDVVRRLLVDETAVVAEWSSQVIQQGLSGFGVGRLHGHAQSADGEKAWSLILKILHPNAGGAAETDFHYWRREALIYDSGLLDDFPVGLSSPRCVAINNRPVDHSRAVGEVIRSVDAAAAAHGYDNDGTHEIWIWLEEIADAEALWPLERYGLAARHLGRMNGRYLVGKPLPQSPWLRRPDVDERLALAESGIPQLPELRNQPAVAELLDEERVDRITHLWNRREQLLDLLNRLPQTFCHRDAGRLNLMATHAADGSEQTTALDWGSAGIGMLGEEIVPLFAASLAFVEIDLNQIPELERLVFDGYVAGLRDAGWNGDEQLVRFGFTALAALKRGVADLGHKLPRIAKRVAALPPDLELPKLLDAGGVEQANAVNDHLLHLGEEALQLLDRLGSF